MDRLINNREPGRLVLTAVFLLLASTAAAWFMSGRLTDIFATAELRHVLSLAADVSEYGYNKDMPTALLPEYAKLRMMLFCSVATGMAIVCLVMCAAALFETDQLLIRLEAIYSGCRKLAEHSAHEIALQGEAFSSVRRVSEGVNLLAGRMQLLTEGLQAEQQRLIDFLSDFSHQIKNCLAGIRLNSDMLLELEQMPAAQREQISAELSLQLEEMEKLVLSSLKLAKLNADAVLYEKENTSLTETCRIALRRAAPTLRQHGVRAEAWLEQEILFPHDRIWMTEAVLNLLLNAAEHANCTELMLKTESIPGAVRFSVSDNGKGIPQTDIPKLFSRFSSRNSTGLGLAIAKKIIEAHDGAVSVYSEVSGGTKFEIVLLKP